MEAMGFAASWIDKVMMCVPTVPTELCWMTSFLEPINPQWGLRQGDLLSSYLFILCSEGFTCLIKDRVRRGLIIEHRCIEGLWC